MGALLMMGGRVFAQDTHEYVDLGLPSGTLWATCNVGANAPEEYGDYFAWGETAPKDVYNWSTYQYYDGSNLAKYTGSDGLTTLLPEDDAATTNWGNEWRMPTKEEWQELLDNTTNKWTTQNGVNGRLFTGSNGNSLFLPAVGFRWDDDLNLARMATTGRVRSIRTARTTLGSSTYIRTITACTVSTAAMVNPSGQCTTLL